MIDVAFVIFSYSYESYRLRGFFLWITGASIFGILLNLYAIFNTSYPKFFFAFTILSMILIILTWVINFLLLYLTNAGKNPISNSEKEKKLKRILSLICLFSSFGGILLNLFLFIFYLTFKFEKSEEDIFLFFLLDTWVALACYYFIIGKFLNYEMESIKQIIKENERLEKEKDDVDSEIEEYFKQKDNKNVEVFVSNQNSNDNMNTNNNAHKKKIKNNVNIFPSIRSVMSADYANQDD